MWQCVCEMVHCHVHCLTAYVLFQDFCRKQSGSTNPIPYYETSTKFTDSILLAFQEIMARPLINDYVVGGSCTFASPALNSIPSSPNPSLRSKLQLSRNRRYLFKRYVVGGTMLAMKCLY